MKVVLNKEAITFIKKIYKDLLKYIKKHDDYNFIYFIGDTMVITNGQIIYKQQLEYSVDSNFRIPMLSVYELLSCNTRIKSCYFDIDVNMCNLHIVNDIHPITIDLQPIENTIILKPLGELCTAIKNNHTTITTIEKQHLEMLLNDIKAIKKTYRSYHDKHEDIYFDNCNILTGTLQGKHLPTHKQINYKSKTPLEYFIISDSILEKIIPLLPDIVNFNDVSKYNTPNNNDRFYHLVCENNIAIIIFKPKW